MSENTNTLFWVITGAVIVLAVFSLINGSQSNKLPKIFDKFNNYYEEATYEDTNESNDRQACKNYAITKDNGLYGTLSYFRVNDTNGFTELGYYFKNTSSRPISGVLRFITYKCGTNEVIHRGYTIVDELQPNEETSLFTNFTYVLDDYQFYFDFYVE